MKDPAGVAKSSGAGGFGGGGRGIADKRDADTKPAVAEGKPPAAPRTESAPLPSESPKPAAKERKAETAEMKSLEKLHDAPANAPLGDNARGAGDAKEPRSGPREKASKSRATADREDLSRKSADLLWQSGLPANKNGEAALDVRLPAEEGDYWLVIDVQGPNGVGKLQKRISVRVPPAAPAKP